MSILFRSTPNDEGEDVVDKGTTVGDETSFCRRASATTETTVVDGEDVGMGLVREGTVSVRAPSLGYVACVTVDW